MLTPDIDPIPPEVLTEFDLANLFDVRSNATNYTSHNGVTSMQYSTTVWTYMSCWVALLSDARHALFLSLVLELSVVEHSATSGFQPITVIAVFYLFKLLLYCVPCHLPALLILSPFINTIFGRC